MRCESRGNRLIVGHRGELDCVLQESRDFLGEVRARFSNAVLQRLVRCGQRVLFEVLGKLWRKPSGDVEQIGPCPFRQRLHRVECLRRQRV